MTATSISLLSIILGILGSNIGGLVFKKFSFGFIGNTIVGVFGSIFTVKAFGRLGFDPHAVMESGSVDLLLLLLNLFISFLSGAMAVVIAFKLKARMNSNKEMED